MILDNDQIRQLADRLVDTSKNVYREAEAMFPGAVVNDETFSRLENVGKIFRCEECSRWQTITFHSEDVEGLCEDCVEEIDNS